MLYLCEAPYRVRVRGRVAWRFSQAYVHADDRKHAVRQFRAVYPAARKSPVAAIPLTTAAGPVTVPF